jgi:hypothetical protein
MKHFWNKRLLIKLILVIVVSLLIVAITSVVGYAIGATLTYQITSGTFERWQSLGIPPQKASKILKADTMFVYVTTTQNKVYYCQTSPQGDCWVEPHDLDNDLQTRDSDCGSFTGFQTAKPPGKVIDSIEAKFCFIEGVIQRNYVILEDGSVWTWTHGGGMGDIGVGFVCVGVGSIVGFLVGVVLAVAVSRTIWRRLSN